MNEITEQMLGRPFCDKECRIRDLIKLSLDHFRLQKSLDVLGGIANPATEDFVNVKCPSRVFGLHENNHATRLITLSTEELGITSKNNLEGITLGIGFIRGFSCYPSSLNQTFTFFHVLAKRHILTLVT